MAQNQPVDALGGAALTPWQWAEQGTRSAGIPQGSVSQLKTGVVGPGFGSRMFLLEADVWESVVSWPRGRSCFFSVHSPFQQASLWNFFLWRGISSCGFFLESVL